MGAIIKCCLGCVAPKRHPGCHGTCPEYLSERAVYDELKTIADKKKNAVFSVMTQKSEGVRRALKGKKGKK